MYDPGEGEPFGHCASSASAHVDVCAHAIAVGAYFFLEQDEDDMQERLVQNHARATSQRAAASSGRTSPGPSVRSSTSALRQLAPADGNEEEGGGGSSRSRVERVGRADDSAFGTPSDQNSPCALRLATRV